jgi:murein DD-endopeptidase
MPEQLALGKSRGKKAPLIFSLAPSPEETCMVAKSNPTGCILWPLPWLFAILLLLFVEAIAPAITPAFAQSSARPSPVPVEVVTPKPPTPVVIEGKRVLVYELHITNFGPSSLTLIGLQVFASAGESSLSGKTGGDKLADFSGSSLVELLHPVEEVSPMAESSHPASQTNPGKLAIGRRVIAFLYVPVPGDLRISALRHRFLFEVADPSRSQGTPNDESALDGILVPVLQRSPPVLASPFKDGVWLAGNGPSNTSVHRRSVIALDGRAYLSQRFAINWVMVGNNGNTFHDSRERNENFWGFGQPVLAVADGEVTEVVDAIPDNVPGKLPLVTVQNITGNHVIVRIAADTYVMFAHLKQGSLRVSLHQKIKRGAQVAQVGNSGNTTGAHLHFQVSDANSPIAAEGIPFLFDRFRFFGLGKDFEQDHHPDLPRSRTLPADGSVITFP